MIDFFVIDSVGLITTHGSVANEADALLNAPDGQTLNFGSVPHGMTHYINNAFVDRRPKPTYSELRREAYPAVTELADALYWQSQGDESKMRDYLDKCAAVKAAIPKVE